VKGEKNYQRGVITVEAALIMPVIIGILVLFYSLAMIEYQNVIARAEAMRVANRAAMNWNTIGGNYTIFDEDMKEPFFADGTENTGKSGKNIIVSASYEEHDPYRFFVELFTVGSKKQENMKKYLDRRMDDVREQEIGMQVTTTDHGIKGDSSIHIFNRYVSITIDNTYNSPMLEFLKGLGFSVKKDYSITVKAKLTEPADFVRNVSYIQELMRRRKK